MSFDYTPINVRSCSVISLAECSDGQLRLVSTSEEHHGYLEICSDQRWKRFSMSYWTINNARVACFELGYQSMLSLDS